MIMVLLAWVVAVFGGIYTGMRGFYKTGHDIA